MRFYDLAPASTSLKRVVSDLRGQVASAARGQAKNYTRIAQELADYLALYKDIRADALKNINNNVLVNIPFQENDVGPLYRLSVNEWHGVFYVDKDKKIICHCFTFYNKRTNTESLFWKNRINWKARHTLTFLSVFAELLLNALEDEIQ